MLLHSVDDKGLARFYMILSCYTSTHKKWSPIWLIPTLTSVWRMTQQWRLLDMVEIATEIAMFCCASAAERAPKGWTPRPSQRSATRAISPHRFASICIGQLCRFVDSLQWQLLCNIVPLYKWNIVQPLKQTIKYNWILKWCRLCRHEW